MKMSLRINTISALQIFQLLRFLCFLAISIYFTKVPLSEGEIGDWEMLLYISSALSFFWVTGIIQSFLPLSQRNLPFSQHERTEGKSPELFNSFLLLLIFSLGFALLIWLMYHASWRQGVGSKIPYPGLLIAYFIVSNTTPLIEHIYLLQKRAMHIFWYGIISTVLQIVAVCAPIMIGLGLQAAIIGLVIVNFARFLFLLGLLYRYAEFKFSWQFILNHLYVGYPIMLSVLLSGSTQYLDGLVATIAFDKEKFAVFRYGCKELPFVVMMTSGLHNALLPRFAVKKDIPKVLDDIKRKSLRLMHFLFPLSILIMIFSKFLYGRILFNESFYRSADVFMVYQLMIISRIVFPQTILIGMKKTKALMRASVIECAINIPTSLFLVQYYSIVGIALGSSLIHILEKLILIGYVYRRLKIKPQTYIPINWYIFYSLLIGLVFVLIDHRIIYLV